jgi:hypothetical protein
MARSKSMFSFAFALLDGVMIYEFLVVRIFLAGRAARIATKIARNKLRCSVIAILRVSGRLRGKPGFVVYWKLNKAASTWSLKGKSLLAVDARAAQSQIAPAQTMSLQIHQQCQRSSTLLSEAFNTRSLGVRTHCLQRHLCVRRSFMKSFPELPSLISQTLCLLAPTRAISLGRSGQSA